MSLNELFNSYRNNPCERLLTEVLKESQSLIYGIAFNIVKHNQDAEDLTQEVLIKVINNINLLPKNTNFPGWLNRTALHASIDLYNQKKRAKALSPEFQEPQNNQKIADVKETISIIYQHLSKLGDTEKSLVIDKHIHQMTYAQLSNLYHLPVPTIQKRIETILKRLRGSIEKAGFAGVAIGLTSALEQLIKPDAAIDLVSKLKMHFPSSYPKASAELLSSKVSIKTMLSAIQGQTLNIVIGVVLLISLTGLYLAYDALSRDEKPINENAPIAKNNSSYKKENGRNITNTKLQNIENTTPKGNSVVVDQTLFSPKAKEEKPQAVNEVLGAIKEKIEIEITLLDSETNKLLIDYEVDLEMQYNFDLSKNERTSLKSDSSGKISSIPIKTGGLRIHITSPNYAPYTKLLGVHHGKNEITAKLVKGGSLIIHATNVENKVIENLYLKLVNENTNQEKYSCAFDPSKGVYVVNNLPIGTQGISFGASGYFDSPLYKIQTSAKKIEHVELRLLFEKKIYFDVVVNPKPNSIQINGREVVFKNQAGLYEYFISKLINELVVSVENYSDQLVNIKPDTIYYSVSPKKNILGKLQINSANGKPIKDAVVLYSLYPTEIDLHNSIQMDQFFFQTNFSGQRVVTNEEGIAILSILPEKKFIRMLVCHENYFCRFDNWLFNENIDITKKIALFEGKNPSGNIQFDDKLVSGAKVILFQKGNTTPLFSTNSESNGRYHFDNNIELKSENEYLIEASHIDYGVATSKSFKFENRTLEQNLTLISEKSVSIKLIDSIGNTLPNKTFTLICSDRLLQNYSVVTNEKGEYEFFNLRHGEYFFHLHDDFLTLSGSRINIPTKNVVLVAKQKEFLKLVLTTHGGVLYKGILSLKALNASQPAINVSVEEDGSYKIELPISDGNYLIETENFSATILSYQKNITPKELNIELLAGENINVKVVGDNNNPVPFEMVSVSKGERLLLSKQTNENGNINFSNLSGKIELSVAVDNYAPFKSEFDISPNKEVLIKLIKGGNLRGQLTLNNKVNHVEIALRSNSNTFIQSPFYKVGSFEFKNIFPGEYGLTVQIHYADGKNINKKIPIKIENESNVEINLDEDSLK